MEEKEPDRWANVIYNIWYVGFFPIALPFAYIIGWLYSHWPQNKRK